MNLNIELDTKNNKCFANKIFGETNYYIGLTKVCARCGNAIIGYPAISRKDNETEICSNCGTLEALEDLMEHDRKSKKSYKELLEKYYKLNENEEDTKEIETELYKNYGTDKYCPRCKHQLLVSDLKDYKYLCLKCDENFYGMEISESGEEE